MSFIYYNITGSKAQKDRDVNKCLYRFFLDINRIILKFPMKKLPDQRNLINPKHIQERPGHLAV